MPLIYRRDLDRPLTFEEMDGNLEYLDRYAEDVEIVVEHIDEISEVAASINGVNAVAGSLPSVITTSLHVNSIETVAGDTENIDTVAGLSAEVITVAAIASDVTAVASDVTNIDAVAGDLTNIDAVAAIASDVTVVAGIEADVTTVAGIASDVSAVAAINDDILTVSFINGDVVTVANNSDNITTVATNIAGILAAQGYADDAATSAGEAAASALEAAGYLTSTEVVYEHFDARYLGAKATAPTHDNQGDPLVVGALYFDTTIGFMYSWTGTVWQSLAAAGGVDSVNGRVGDVVLTASDVGLENVTNESKATMFDDSAFTGSTTVESLQFTGGTGAQGTMSWNSDEETLDLIQDGATLQLGQELQTHCRNNTASSIPNATVVMATGTLGASGRITIAPWDGTTDIKYILGVTTEVIEAGTDGKVTTFGKVREVDTGAISGTLTTGVIYAKTDGTGGLTYTKPASNAVPLAFLVSAESAPSANNGTIMVRVTPVSETILDHAETAYGWGNHASAGYATASNLSAHTGNTSNPHSVTATQVGLGNVENKSSATIRSEITSSNVTTALGYTPYNSTNPSGYITGITSGMVTTALGFTPLSTTGTAADSDKLDGQHGSYYQPASTAITTSNIGSQSVNYATSAGSVADGSVTAAKMANSGYEFGMRNRIINGAMMIDQRNNGAALNSIASGVTYTVDRWFYQCSQAGKFNAQQNAGAVTPPQGFNNYLGFTSTGVFSPASTDYIGVSQAIEGYNWNSLSWGTASAQAVTLSFVVRSSLAGTHSGAIRVYGSARSYPFTFSISSADTWETKTVSIPGDTSGTYNKTNSGAVLVCFNLGSGSNYLASSGSWTAQDSFGATGAVSVAGTNGATFYITGVQLEKGSVATPFEFRPYGTELALCQRYYEGGVYWNTEGDITNTGQALSNRAYYKVTKRATPTLSNFTLIASSNFNVGTLNNVLADANGVSIYGGPSVSGHMFVYYTFNASAEL